MANTCRSCGAEIVWAVTDTGGRIPLSKASEQKRFVLHEGVKDPIARMQPTYVTHFVDCPDADEHRKTR
jgi:hypothetical protein